MRVKRLEIQGFKSFKDKTVIHFDHSITGIVGPNGCGKSNIVDAFFWVMGEQSYKHMRGNSSEDLIFNGSSKYSPVGLAEATLVLETKIVDKDLEPAGASVSDAPVHVRTKEISVTRRLYRSGEGEYFINGNTARLKDIHELFMDTGVGAKGYSVIEQGQIGKIVNSKPEERRLLIEEAAGIAKYKARKKESLRKMESTQANLSRLTDIIQEIEKSLNSLERQAQKARQYRKYKDELQDKEVTWARRKTLGFQKRLEELKTRKNQYEQDLVGLRAELQTAENTVEVDRIELVTQTKEAETLQAQIQDLADDFSQERSALELSRRRQGDLSTQLQALATEKEELQTTLLRDDQRIGDIENQVSEADEYLELAHTEAESLFGELDEFRRSVEAARQQVETSQRDLRAGLKHVSEMTSRSASLLTKAEAAQLQVTRLSQQREDQEERLLSFREELEKIRSQSEEVQTQKGQLQEERKEQSTQVQSLEQEVRQLEREKDTSLKAMTQLRSRLQSLEELDQSHAGLADGPKAALDFAKTNGQRNQIHALTDVLQVKDGYETILQSWLESKMESLLIHNPELGLSIFDRIREKKQGRVTLQLAETHSAKKSASPSTPPPAAKIQALLEENGFTVLGELTEFVTTTDRHATLDALLSHVLIVENSAPLPAFISQGGVQSLSGWSLVSRDGVALEAQGVLRGGSLDTSGAVGILQRKKIIQELRVQTTEAEARHQELETGFVQKKQTIEISRARLQTLQSDLQALEIQFAALARDIHQTERAHREAEGQLVTLQEDYEELEATVIQSREERAILEAKLQELLESQSHVEESISTAVGALAERESARHEKEEELHAIRVKEASLRERAQSLKRERDATRSLIADRKRRLTEIDRTLERATREHSEHSGGESELTERIEELTLALATKREALAEVKNKIEQLNSTVNTAMEKAKSLHKGGDQKTSETTQLALEIEKLSSELSFLIQNLEEKYGPGCLNATPQITRVALEPEVLPALGDEEEELNPPERVNSSLLAALAQDLSDPGEEASALVAAQNTFLPELTHEQEAALGAEVEKLRERIRRLGEVNVMAIEEFEELKKRYDHLVHERTDLEQSLKNLESAIEHINKTSEERFSKAFDAIAERFERLFPIIFGGGMAKLSLVYPEASKDILEAGVDILAQPPGKKVSNITLLSGGEKALTAVSLIFAIFMVKPSPFCVLDEVDAPLDDANIGKFNALLREMSVKSQFIIITHNKKTMELNDTLYGVTMEEPGVSKMVSIEMH